MTQSRNRQLVPLAVLGAALIAAGAAYAASRAGGSPSSAPLSLGYAAAPISANSGRGGHGPGDGRRGGHGDDLAAAATYLGIPQADLLTSLQSGKTLAQIAGSTSGKSVAALIDALVAGEKSELAAAVKAGTITQAQADQIETTLTARATAEVNGTRPDHGPGGPGHGFGHGPGGDDFTAAATYLGLTEAALTTQLQAGKTLAQIGDATGGKSAAGLIDALVAHETTELDAAVKAGSITQAQRDALVPQLKARFTALANGTRPEGDDHHGPGFKPSSTAPASSGTHI